MSQVLTAFFLFFCKLQPLCQSLPSCSLLLVTDVIVTKATKGKKKMISALRTDSRLSNHLSLFNDSSVTPQQELQSVFSLLLYFRTLLKKMCRFSLPSLTTNFLIFGDIHILYTLLSLLKEFSLNIWGGVRGDLNNAHQVRVKACGMCLYAAGPHQ